MNLSMKWLSDFVTVTADARSFASDMTMSGSKVETYERISDEIENVVVGKVLSIDRHPDADKLVVCQIDVAGERPLQIVTGASNLNVGDVVPVCQNGAKLPGGKTIKTGKLRGVLSEGMLCSLGELGLTLHDFPDAIEDGIFVITDPCELGTDICSAIGLDDTTVEFEITSNRPDCLSVIGLAREAAATYNLPLSLNTPVVKGGAGKSSELLSVSVEDKDLCRRYAARVVKNIKIAPSPRWMRERLRASGVRPINNIVDITNYVMLEYGQPMHAFDYSFLTDGKIIVRRAKAGETITTLDGVDHELTTENLVICDAAKPVAVAGVMGGENSEIQPETKDIVFESANFFGASVRRTAKALGIRTESSARFEKGLDPEMVPMALARACGLVELLGCGEVCDDVVEVDSTSHQPVKIVYDPDYINRFLGTDIPEKRIREILETLDFSIQNQEIIVPSYRSDIEHKADIAEEVARIFGYNNIPSTLFKGGTAQGRLSSVQSFEKKIANVLLSDGYNEIYTYTFISPKFYDAICMPADSSERRSVTILNPLGEDTSIMRTTALPSLLDALSRNYAQRNASAAFYELAKIFLPKESTSELPIEKKIYTFGSYGCGDFYTLKGAVENMLTAAGIKSAEFAPYSDHYAFHPGKTAILSIEGKPFGILGEIHPAVTQNYDIKLPVYAAMIDFDTLFASREDKKEYHPLPKFPAVSRDLALLCDSKVLVRDIENIFKKHGKKLLEKITLFDVYTGKQIPEGKKSIAYSLTLRAEDRTLTDEEIERITAKIMKDLENEYQITIR